MDRSLSLWIALAFTLVAAGAGCAKGTLTPGSSDAAASSTSGSAGGGGASAATTGSGGASQGGGGGATSSAGGGSTTGEGGGATSSAGGGSTTGEGGGATTATSGSGGTGGEPPHPCGDGMLGVGEECDGANLGGATCASKGFAGGTITCNGQCKLDTTKCDACHNGVIQPALGEDCDFDAMQKPLILATCQSLGFMSPNNPGCDPSCHYDTTPCLCGDGMIAGMEHCDGLNLGGKSCADQGFGGGVLACSPTCQFDHSGCTLCGNGMIDAAEPCDGADLGGKTCVTQGFGAGQLACGAGCQLDTTGCTTCGNGLIEAGESCDGNNLGGKTCVTQGFTAGQLSCTAACGISTAGCTKCGNNVLEAGEGCDDGNLMGGDGCSAACTIEILSCDPDGLYAIIQGGPIAYSCCGGLVAVNISSFIFQSDGASVLSSPSNPKTMQGQATTCPAGNIDVSSSIAGGCTESYTLSGSFTGPDTWSGVYTLGFSGSQCDCFGGILGTPCITQVFGITAMR